MTDPPEYEHDDDPGEFAALCASYFPDDEPPFLHAKPFAGLQWRALTVSARH